MGPKPGKTSSEAAQATKSGLSTYDPSRGDSTVWARARCLKTLRRGAVPELAHRYPQIAVYVGRATRGGTDLYHREWAVYLRPREGETALSRQGLKETTA